MNDTDGGTLCYDTDTFCLFGVMILSHERYHPTPPHPTPPHA